MRRSLVAGILLVTFLGAGTSLPGLDELLYHSRPSTEHLGPHVEPAGGCGAHADDCSLGRASSGAGAFVEAAPVLRETLPSPRSVTFRSIAPSVAAAADRLPRSRAPPAHQA
jgi:hypothetical protein